MSVVETTQSKGAPAAQPSNTRLEEALRDAVKASFSAGKPEELTVKRLRTVVESELNLDQGFFKAHDDWNAKSKKIIQDAVDQHEEDGEDSKLRSPAQPPKPEQKDEPLKKGVKRSSPKASPAPRKRVKPSPEPDTKPTTSTSNTKKRPSPVGSEETRKRQKTSPSVDPEPKPPLVPNSRSGPKAEESGSELSEPPSEVQEPPPKPKAASKRSQAKRKNVKNGAKKGANAKAEEVDAGHSSDGDKAAGKTTRISENSPPKVPITKDILADDSSELSSLIDDEPAPAKRGRNKKKTSSPPPAKPPKKTKKTPASAKPSKPSKPTKPASTAAAADLTSDEAEIKRLQSWLLKCGIRKLWHRELAPHPTPAAKIAHLKSMLRAVGMEGRFSVEKARAVKERRELEMDLEAVREGEKRWGNNRRRASGSGDDDGSDDAGGGEEEVNGEAKPRRRLAKSLQGLDFLNDDDGEETD
ncbi:MAG: hypothetical protein M1821_007661 [Bathelium mastoideum]|nr:MAG: hypothetical protein M1821_007661 [Bathelium mastoideum]KAI9685672.1 MAG: hypothetical protein M1822_004232 [Bathelium mastoideum]